jgi:hypothetical protein
VGGAPTFARDDMVSVGFQIVAESLPGRVVRVRRCEGGFAVSVELLEPSFELADFVAHAMFEPTSARHSRFSVLHYGYARYDSAGGPSLPH